MSNEQATASDAMPELPELLYVVQDPSVNDGQPFFVAADIAELIYRDNVLAVYIRLGSTDN